MSRAGLDLMPARATIVGILFVASACGGSSEPLAPQTIALRIEGDGFSGEIATIVPQPVTVEVHAGGRSAAGMVVRFEPLPSRDPAQFNTSTVFVSKLGRNYFQSFVSDTVDATGRVSVNVKLGIVPGDGRMLVRCPELGLVDTARFTVLAAGR